MDDDKMNAGGSAEFYKPTETLRDLQALEAIEHDPAITQRSLSQRLGVALGISNSLIHTLVRKGLIKIRGEGRRSLTYHLTHKGLVEKGRLAAQYTMNTIDFYRLTRQAVAKTLAKLHESGVRSIAFYGWNELAEISSVVSAQIPLDIMGVIDTGGADDGAGDDGLMRPPDGLLVTFEELASNPPDTIIVCRPLSDSEKSALRSRFPSSTIAVVPSGELISGGAE